MDKLDPVAVAILITGSLLGPELAQVIGPYAVIFLASTTGAAWALGRREPLEKRTEIVWYFSKINFTSLLATWPLSMLAHTAFELQEANWLLVPIALVIGGIGHDWPRVGRWVVERLGRLIERRAGVGDAKGD